MWTSYASEAIAATELSTLLLGLHEIYIVRGLREAINKQIAEIAQSDTQRDSGVCLASQTTTPI